MERIELSRREFVAKGGLALAGAVVGLKAGELFAASPPDPMRTSMERAHRTALETPVEVIGLEHPLASNAEIENTIDKPTNDAFMEKARVKALQKGIAVPTDEFALRELVLDRNIRYLDIAVAKSVFDKYTQDAQSGADVDFVTSMKIHIAYMNQKLSENAYAPARRMQLRRILIVNDSILKTLPTYPMDIDARWEVNHDLKQDRPSTSSEFINGKYINISHSLIHELHHMLNNVPDEYLQNVDIPELPKFFIAGDGHSPNTGVFLPSQGRRTPWVGLFLRWGERINMRGYYTDPRSLDPTSKVPDNAYSFFNKRPENISLTFRGKKGELLNGKVTVKKIVAQDTSKSYYGPRRPEAAQEAILQNGQMIVYQNWFIPPQRKDTLYPLTWYLELSTQNGKYDLYLPAAAFNMSSAVGTNKADYTIKFNQRELESKSPRRTQRAEIADKKTSSIEMGIFRSANLYAEMNIPGTPCEMYWFQEPRSESPQPKVFVPLIGYQTKKPAA